MMGAHPNVVKVLGVAFPGDDGGDGTTDSAAHDQAPMLLLEHLGRGSMDTVLAKDPASLHVPRAARDAAAGLACAHANGVLHLDVSARNCLVADDGTTKVADFGLARRLGLSAAVEGDSYGPYPWMAPESLLPPFMYSPGSDTYMYGGLLYEMTHGGQMPWEGCSRAHVTDVLCRDKRPLLLAPPTPADAVVAQCMRDCLQLDPAARPKLQDVCLALDARCKALGCF